MRPAFRARPQAVNEYERNLALLVRVGQKQAGLVFFTRRVDQADVGQPLEVALRDLVNQRRSQVRGQRQGVRAEGGVVVAQRVVQLQEGGRPTFAAGGPE